MPTLPASPCINVCRMDPDSGLCSGCFRTLDEIANWSRLDATARLSVLEAVNIRQRSQQTSPPARLP